uniref:Putative secreted protein n=1 Tax=Ixodes ricinus TaxID=34613 RepID=A0A6B0UDP8_IXORI
MFWIVFRFWPVLGLGQRDGCRHGGVFGGWIALTRLAGYWWHTGADRVPFSKLPKHRGGCWECNSTVCARWPSTYKIFEVNNHNKSLTNARAQQNLL